MSAEDGVCIAPAPARFCGVVTRQTTVTHVIVMTCGKNCNERPREAVGAGARNPAGGE